MALQKSYTPGTKITSPEAYHRVTGIRIWAENSLCDVDVKIFHDKNTRTSNGDPIAQVGYTFQGPNFRNFFANNVLQEAEKSPIRQAYLMLKRLPEYDGCVDV